MSQKLSSSAQKVQEALKASGLTCRVVEMPNTTRTADDAARAVGCQVGQIAKSLVFRAEHSLQAVLVVASGANRVNERKIEALIAEPITKADADFVRAKTGFAIGGVAPVGHAQSLTIFIDEDLFKYDDIWAAAGTPKAVFKLTPGDLQKITSARVVSVK